MITKDFMDSFVLKFKECYQLENKWNQKLFSKDDNVEWTSLFYERSKELRDAFNFEEELIGELKVSIHNDLSAKEAEILYDALKDLYFAACDDFVVLELLINPLINYYKKVNDYDKVIFLLHAKAFEETEFYIESNTPANEKGLEYYYEIFGYQDKYEVLNRDSRVTIFKAYSNLIAALFEKIKTNVGTYFQVRQRALGLWYSNRVQKLDKDDQEFNYFIDKITSSVFRVGNLESLSNEAISALKMTYDRYQNNRKFHYIDSDATCGIKYKLDYHEHRINIDDLMDVLYDLYDESYNKFVLDNEDSSDYLELATEYIHNIISYLNELDFPEDLKPKALEYVYKHRDLLANLPYSYYTTEINYLVYEFYQAAHKLLNGFKEKLDFILDVIMFRQPVTYIHSIMVRNISELITKSIIELRPELLIGINGTLSRADVINNKEKILEYVRNAAMLHDVGKVTCVKIINTQNRRLDDREFKIIRSHPENGRKVLCDDPDFIHYYDVIEGHHRYYDGSFGYPPGFDNTHSKSKIIIDIVSIADSTDAATDILGRNYTSGKSFVDLLGELIRGSKVRYNPDIVNLINDDLELIKELTDMTTKGRLAVYEEVYKKYINKRK